MTRALVTGNCALNISLVDLQTKVFVLQTKALLPSMTMERMNSSASNRACDHVVHHTLPRVIHTSLSKTLKVYGPNKRNRRWPGGKGESRDSREDIVPWRRQPSHRHHHIIFNLWIYDYLCLVNSYGASSFVISLAILITSFCHIAKCANYLLHRKFAYFMLITDLTTSLPAIMNDAKLAANTRFEREIYLADQMKGKTIYVAVLIRTLYSHTHTHSIDNSKKHKNEEFYSIIILCSRHRGLTQHNSPVQHIV